MYKLLLRFLIVCQLLDGILTYSGISFYGLSAEGNPLVKYLVLHLGAIPALILVKSIAISAICLLGKFSPKDLRFVKMEKKILAVLLFLACLYSFAVISWIYVLNAECGHLLCLIR